MKNLKSFGIPLSRNEMRIIMAGKLDPNGGFHGCGRDCRVQSPAFTCAGGVAPVCYHSLCTLNDGTTSFDYSFSCGMG